VLAAPRAHQAPHADRLISSNRGSTTGVTPESRGPGQPAGEIQAVSAIHHPARRRRQDVRGPRPRRRGCSTSRARQAWRSPRTSPPNLALGGNRTHGRVRRTPFDRSLGSSATSLASRGAAIFMPGTRLHDRGDPSTWPWWLAAVPGPVNPGRSSNQASPAQLVGQDPVHLSAPGSGSRFRNVE